MKIFRLSGVIIAAVFAVVVWLLATVVVNYWLKNIVESQGSKANGATVALNDSSIGWLSGGLLFEGLSIANPDDLMSNRIELDRLQFDLSIQSLLKGDLHVDKLDVLNIKLNQPRQQAAEKFQSSDAESGFNWPKRAVAKAKSVDVQALLQKVNIQSPEMYREFSERLTTQKQQWQQQRESLPDKARIEQHQAEYKKLQAKLKDANALEKLKVAKDIKQLLKEVDADRKKIAEFKQSVSDGIGGIKSDWQSLQKQVGKDTDLAMSIASLSPEGIKHLASSFLGESTAHWLHLALDNVDRLKALSSNKNPDKKAAEPREGVDIAFGPEPVKPSLWIKQTAISGLLQMSGQQGQVSGEASNIASELLPGLPMSLNMAMLLPDHQKASGNLSLKVRHKQDSNNPVSGKFDLNQWPIENWSVSEGQINLSEALMNANLDIATSESSITLDFNAQLTDFKLKSDLSNADNTLRQLTDVLNEAERIDLNIKVTKTDSQTTINLSSNLDKLLFNKVKQELQQKADAVKQKVRASVEQKVAEQKAAIEDKLSGLLQFDEQLKKQLSELDMG